MLRDIDGLESHLIVSPAGLRTAVEEEVAESADEIRRLADVVHSHKDIGASIASGSFRSHGMLVAPCSIKTLSSIAHCYSDDLITRAADVCLKERRRVVLMVRETPLHAGHITLMDQATRNGRALDLFDIDHPSVRRWKQEGAA
jgi:4-hydroxy-3-polyprenylbenzoate decarboxylase